MRIKITQPFTIQLSSNKQKNAQTLFTLKVKTIKERKKEKNEREKILKNHKVLWVLIKTCVWS